MYLFFYMALGFMIFMGGNPLLGILEGVGLENLGFLDPNVTRFARCRFRAKKNSFFRAHPFQWPSK
jgi:hypothetical protein